MGQEYPTKEEILDNIKNSPPTKVEKAIMEEWKDCYYKDQWKGLDKEQKREAIECLIQDLWDWLGHEHDLYIVWDEQPWSYHPASNTIYGEKPSIISALHELGHAVFGESELAACAFSVGLFSECFPNEYSRLVWDGHMLISK